MNERRVSYSRRITIFLSYKLLIIIFPRLRRALLTKMKQKNPNFLFFCRLLKHINFFFPSIFTLSEFLQNFSHFRLLQVLKTLKINFPLKSPKPLFTPIKSLKLISLFKNSFFLSKISF